MTVFRRWACLLLTCSAFSALTTASELQRLINATPSGSGVGIAVFDCETNEWLFTNQADTPLRLASVTKLLVSSAALIDLGPDYEFSTRVVAMPPIVNGRAQHLGIIGGGSPCLDEHFTDGDPDRILRNWAASLRNAGIQGSNGDLLIDSSMFDQTWRPSTYPDDQRNAQQWYSAPASGFAFNDNCIDLQVVPTSLGQRAQVNTRPHSSRITISNKTSTVSGKGDGRLNVYRHHHSNTLVVSGRYAKPSAWFTLSIRDDADLLAGDHVQHIWNQHGITIGGQVRRAPISLANAQVIVDHRDPLVPALTILNQRSQNFYGEQILRTLGHKHSGLGSTTAGCDAVAAILQKSFGLGNSLSVLDGSGLSYDNRGSAREICILLDRMLDHQHRDIWLSTLKERDVAGTIVLAKTGTLAVARCLAGYAPRKNGGWVAFAILLNRGSGKSIGWAATKRNEFAKAIVESVSKP